MLPRFSIPYPVDHREAYAELFRDCWSCDFPMKLSYLRDFIRSQFGEMMILPKVERRLGLSQELNGVAMVLAASNYFEVLGSGVMPYPISMVYFHAFRYRTDESGRDETMDSEKRPPKFQSHARISRIIAGPLQNIPTQAVHSSKVAYVAPWVAFYRLPNFARIVFRHLDNLLSRCLGPIAAFARCIGSPIAYQLDSMAAIGKCHA